MHAGLGFAGFATSAVRALSIAVLLAIASCDPVVAQSGAAAPVTFATAPASTPLAAASVSSPPVAQPLASALSTFGTGGGGRALTCIGLTTDVHPRACSDPSFCHRLSLADVHIAVAMVSGGSKHAVTAHYESLDRLRGLGGASALRDCFGHEPASATALGGRVVVALAGDWGECPAETARIVERSVGESTGACVRDTLKRWVLPPGTGKVHVQLEVSVRSAVVP